MIFYVLIFFGFNFSTGLKTWISNTNVDNPSNWDKFPTSDKCQKINLDVDNDITMFWNLQNIFTTELSLPSFGNVLFPQDVTIRFTNKKECSQSTTVKYIRDEHKNWLDPNNWKSDTESWLPHIERIPCAGEDILFPSGKSFGVQLPSILVPTGKIIFDDQEHDGEEWARLLDSDLGFEHFKQAGSEIRTLPWRNDVGCSHKRECFCARSSYAMKDGLYKDVPPNLLEKMVCKAFEHKCEKSKCLFPITPDGHCCGICGGIIKLQDKTEDGLDVEIIKKKVDKELKINDPNEKIISYVGRTSDGNVQIVFIAKNPADTMKTVSVTNLIEVHLKGANFAATLTAKHSGLPLSNYFFNGPIGIAIGTLLSVLASFLAIYYVYIILPKKKRTEMIEGKPFVFARFENTVQESSSEENLEIATASEALNEVNKSFENPMYSAESKSTKIETAPDLNQASGSKTREEYTNPVYDEFEKSEFNILETENQADDDKAKKDDDEEDQLNIFSEIQI